MAYDAAPPQKLPEPGFYHHFKHDPAGPVKTMPITSTALVTTPKTSAVPRMPLCRGAGHYTRALRPIGTVACPT